MHQSLSVPTKIIVGDPILTYAYAENAVLQTLCQAQGEHCFCATCRSVKQRQHAQVRIISPEKDYTVGDIDAILHESTLQRDVHEPFFFILENTQTLTPHAANRLLKLLEEPPTGYYFYLLTDNLQALLPTIISRAHVIRLDAQINTSEQHPLVQFFCTIPLPQYPAQLDALVMNNQLTDSKSFALLQEIIAWYSTQIMHAIESGDTQHYSYCLNVTEFLQTIMKHPPASGSSTIFWRMLFISFPRK